ncbi:hypothetical protein AVEN_165608-1, partial [Araneus ventricosus]
NTQDMDNTRDYGIAQWSKSCLFHNDDCHNDRYDDSHHDDLKHLESDSK